MSERVDNKKIFEFVDFKPLITALLFSIPLCVSMGLSIETAFGISMALIFANYMYSNNTNSTSTNAITTSANTMFHHRGIVRRVEQPHPRTNSAQVQRPNSSELNGPGGSGPV